ncbi:MAG: hypothetical protein AAGJ79_05670 [Verrucomicrobiota bacterium]
MPTSKNQILAMLLAVIVGAAMVGAFLLVDDQKHRRVYLEEKREFLEPPKLAPEQFTLRPRFGTLGDAPDWSKLATFHETITRERFERELIQVYSEGDAWKSVIEFDDTTARIETTDGTFKLRFAGNEPTTKPPRYWRSASEMPPSSDPRQRPLEGVRIAIDPGHIGGEWARMEERWYQIGDGIEVKEGELVLQTAGQLLFALREGGAEVQLIRSKLEPVTTHRPADFEELATATLLARGQVAAPGDDGPDEATQKRITREAERLFYRAAEIRQRATILNERLQPDLVVCLHFNAEAWGNPNKPAFVPRNHLHFLINGTYSAGELRLHDQRYEMLLRLLQGIHDEELAVNLSVADALAGETGLAPFKYRTPNAKLVSDNPYIYARNLLANRLYQCPVIFCEPFVMNNREVYDRIALGDYEGRRTINGEERLSIFKEYALGVYRGLARYYRERR